MSRKGLRSAKRRPPLGLTPPDLGGRHVPLESSSVRYATTLRRNGVRHRHREKYRYYHVGPNASGTAITKWT